MIYCDASLIVAMLTSEVASDEARDWLERSRGQELAISGWVGAEVASALAMKQRRGALSVAERQGANLQWQALAAGFHSVDVHQGDFREAARLVDAGTHGLRAGDALHLAIAMARGFSMASLDDDLNDAALSAGLQVETIARVA